MSKSSIRNAIRVVGINIGVTIFLLGAVLIVPSLLSDIGTFSKTYILPTRDSKTLLPVYENQPWAEIHFAEMRKLNTRYYDYIGWRKTEFSGQTITIDKDGFRRHTSRANSPEHAKIWVFGGSTVWGVGAYNDGTIPAYLENLLGTSVFNFGEGGYTAHQSLNLLMRLYASGGRPELVIFYDGINDVFFKCRSELGFYSSAREYFIRQKLEKHGSRLLELFGPVVDMISAAVNRLARNEVYNCHTDTKKADLIAKNFAQDWSIAKQLVQSMRGTFVGILQPAAYIGSPNIGYLPQKEVYRLHRLQFESVYPKMRQELIRLNIAYLDLADIFDTGEQVYIDSFHVTPKGNEKISMAIVERLRRSADIRSPTATFGVH